MQTAKKIHFLRKAKGLTLEELGTIVGSPKSYVWDIENKPNVRVSGDKIFRIAKALGTTADYLLDDGSQRDLVAEIDARLGAGWCEEFANRLRGE